MKRILRTTWHHIRRSPYQAFAAILIISQTFFVITVFTLVIYASSQIINYFESRPQVTAFFNDETSTEQIDELKNQLEATGQVESIKYVSKQDALVLYKEQNKSDPLLLELVTADILPASLEISTTEIEYLASISNILTKSSYVSDVVFQKDVVQRLTAWTDAIRKIGIGLVAVLALDSILVMVIIIGIKISQKKDEIEIMKLIGASNWYIRLPFIYEGIFYGVVGALLGTIVSFGILLWAQPILASYLREIPLFPISWVLLLQVFLAEIALAIFLGILASFSAVFRYLK